MSSGAAETEQGARRSGEARIKRIREAQAKLGEAQKEWRPYQELGTKSMKYFDQYQTPGGMAQIYEKFGSTTDPLNKYLSERKERAINRQVAARGKYGSGAAVEAQTLGASELQAQMGNLIEQRVQNELGLQERMLDRGERATGQISDLYKGMADLDTQAGAVEGTMHEQIGAARRTGKQFETGILASAAPLIGGAAGFLIGGPAGMQIGQTIGNAAKEGITGGQSQAPIPQGFPTPTGITPPTANTGTTANTVAQTKAIPNAMTANYNGMPSQNYYPMPAASQSGGGFNMASIFQGAVNGSGGGWFM